MDLSQKSIHDVIHPTAAFSPTMTQVDLHDGDSTSSLPWEDSYLNPKNRIESLDVPKDCCWRIDGCTGFGGEFYAVPLSVEPFPPLRVDVFIPEPSKLPLDMRRVLDIDHAFHTRDALRVMQLGITRHILRMLQHWTMSAASGSREFYRSCPFGSRIVFSNFPKNVADAVISLMPNHNLERQLLTTQSLESFWEDQEITLPPTIQLSGLKFIRQLHDSVCLVQYQSVTWIFKALTSHTKYLYHELKQLLRIPPHPNVVSRPRYLVSKKCDFGGKEAIVGFLLEYHPCGSMRDLLPFLHIHDKILPVDEIEWACQLASALIHIRETTGMFYPDLRLDNIVLSDSQGLVMVDFEQRGVWCEFAAPEVNAIEYVRLLAIDKEIDPSVRGKYAKILTKMLPRWEAMEDGQAYVWPNQGYNIPWSCLTAREQESCEVYMLGRVLWCIFEAVSAPQRAAVWLSYRWEPAVEFPGYTRTPPKMKDLIDRCTRGRSHGLSKLIVRERNKLVLRDAKRTDHVTAELVQETARKWWQKEIWMAENWIAERALRMASGTWNENYYDRPTLREVFDALKSFRLDQSI